MAYGMASGSGSGYGGIHHHQDQEDSSWLDLGLSLGPPTHSTATASAVATTINTTNDHQHLRRAHEGLLGLGFGDDGAVRRPASASLHYYGGVHYSVASSSSSSSQSPCGHLLSSAFRPEVGVWFSLVAFSGWSRESEALPQIPKTYIRVKDENVTILMVKKYLVRKLGLASEFEIDVSCMGKKLLHSQTLKLVRDTIWLPWLIEPFGSLASIEFLHSSLHVMPLRYSRSSS